MIWRIPRTDGTILRVSQDIGDQLYIVGANGSGKSALIQHFVSQAGAGSKVRRVSAHRQTWLRSGTIDFTPTNRKNWDKNLRGYEVRPDARWMDHDPVSKQSAILFDLVAEDNERARSIQRRVDDGLLDAAAKKASETMPPFRRLNELLALGRLTVSLENSKGEEIFARHRGNETRFSMAKMSDGERSAAILAAAVLTADPGTVFLIDEPERHLHRAIIEPFLSALFSERSDCVFVVATHEISLPLVTPGSPVIVVRSCAWNGDAASTWDADYLAPDMDLPEEVRRAVLGARKRVLFVEGTDASLDKGLYSVLFPDTSVTPIGTCVDVQRAVTGLRHASDLHDVEAFGLVDRDDRIEADIAALAQQGVFVLDSCSVEGLYYCNDAIVAIAKRQAEALGSDADEMIARTRERALETLAKPDTAERMAARRCERQARKEALSALPQWKAIRTDRGESFSLRVPLPYTDELRKYLQLVDEGALDQVIARYPLRETRAFDDIATTLRCRNKKDYERMVIARIGKDEDLARRLKSRVGTLADVLAGKCAGASKGLKQAG